MAWEGPGFVDAHVHLLRVAAGVAPCWAGEGVADYHRRLAHEGRTPMDEAPDEPEAAGLADALDAGLREAAALGLVEVTEAGMTSWAYLDALRALRERGPLPVRVRLLVASGIATPGMPRLGDPWLEVIGVKLYADGWLGPRTCAMCRPFADRPDDDGILFLDGEAIARRAEPFAQAGWTVATHAIGDRAIEAVLDGYEHVYGSSCRQAGPRIEHAQVLHPDLVARMAEMGVVACIQPAFGVTDAAAATEALGERARWAYDWALLLDAGVRVVAGSDYPIEPLDPIGGLHRLVNGAEPGGPAVAPVLPLGRALAVMTDATAGTTTLAADPSSIDPAELHGLAVMGTRPRG